VSTTDRGMRVRAVANGEVTAASCPADSDLSEPVFADVARLELDDLLEQLVGRAQEVLTTRDRLRGLLQATRSVAAARALPVVLRQIAESARELLDARYAALGVVGCDGGLTEFIHVGMEATTVAEIGELPRGRGILGRLIADPQPLRIESISEHAASYGFPPHHPPMRSFLGVPIRIRGEVYGNLYVTDKTTAARFSDDDEELATALASTAAVAIENARLFEEVSRRQRWQEATASVATTLLQESDVDPLAAVMTQGRVLVAADEVIVTRPTTADPDLVESLMTDEAGRGHRVAALLPMAGSVVERVAVGGSVTTAEESVCRSVAAGTALADDVGSIISVPLGPAEDGAVLTVLRRTGQGCYSPDDTAMLSHFAEQATVCLELARARADTERLRVLEERDRIARDMHDHVIGRLVGAGLQVQALNRWITDTGGRRTLASHADQLDAAIRDIRTTIYALDGDPRQTWSLPARVQQVISEAVRHLGLTLEVSIDSDLDLGDDDRTVDDLLAVLRESLANIAKHADARRVQIILTGGTSVELTVTDDGRGRPAAPDRSGSGHGLMNMAARAAARGGSFSITDNPTGGTIIHWGVPLSGR